MCLDHPDDHPDDPSGSLWIPLEPVGCGNPFMQLAGTVEEPAKQVTSLYPGLATLVDEVQPNGWTWRLQPKRPMRSVRVVVLA
jgi:hypothetical protein